MGVDEEATFFTTGVVLSLAADVVDSFAFRSPVLATDGFLGVDTLFVVEAKTGMVSY